MKKENVIIRKGTEENWNKAKNFIPKGTKTITVTPDATP